MSLPKFPRSHKFRLTLLTTLTVSIGLAIVFGIVLVVVRTQALNRRYHELSQIADRVSHEWKGPDSLAEEGEDFPGISVSVFSPSQTLLASSSRKPAPFYVGSTKQDETLLVGKTYSKLVVVASSSWRETEAGLRQLALVLAALWLPLTVLTALVAWYGGALFLKPVHELVDSASKLSGSQDDERLNTTDNAEFETLTVALNAMLERIKHSNLLQKQFASDAAHELRTPLAILRTRIETLQLKPRLAEEYDGAMTAMLGEIERLTLLIDTLLTSARMPFGNIEPVDLAGTVNQVIDEWCSRQPDQTFQIVRHLHTAMVKILPDEMGIILTNILDNARKHSPPDSVVKISLISHGVNTFLIVSDEGPGLSEHDRQAVFERFFRVDSARSRSDGGAGIGLAVVKRLVEARGGEIAFLPVDHGASVQITFRTA